MEYPTWLSNLKILLDYNKPDTECAEINIFFIAVEKDGDGNTRSSWRCINAEGQQFLRYKVAS